MNGVARVVFFVSLFLASQSVVTAQAQQRPVRPFENVQRRPSVSPYMNLVNNPQPGATNYQSLVRPQLDQSALNRRQSSAINQLQRQSAPQRSRSSAQGNQQLRGTGHATHFDNRSHYYPAQAR